MVFKKYCFSFEFNDGNVIFFENELGVAQHDFLIRLRAIPSKPFELQGHEAVQNFYLL